MLSFIFDSPKDVQIQLADRFRQLRLFRNLRRKTLAEMSGVPEPSIKRFEVTGEVSLRSLLLLAHALGELDQFGHLFQPKIAKSLEEIEKRERQISKQLKKRGRQ